MVILMFAILPFNFFIDSRIVSWIGYTNRIFLLFLNSLQMPLVETNLSWWYVSWIIR